MYRISIFLSAFLYIFCCRRMYTGRGDVHRRSRALLLYRLSSSF